MAFGNAGVDISREAGQDLSAKQYHFVTIASDGQVDATGDGLLAHGVLQNDPSAAGQGATVRISGVTKVYAGGACTRGGLVSSTAAGRAVNTVSGDFALGVALETGTNDGDIISVKLALDLGKVW